MNVNDSTHRRLWAARRLSLAARRLAAYLARCPPSVWRNLNVETEAFVGKGAGIAPSDVLDAFLELIDAGVFIEQEMTRCRDVVLFSPQWQCDMPINRQRLRRHPDAAKHATKRV